MRCLQGDLPVTAVKEEVERMSSKKPKMSKDKSIETLKRVLDYIAAYRWAVCLSLLLALVTVAFTLYIPILTGKAVDEIVSQGNVDFSALISIIKKIIMQWQLPPSASGL